MSTEEEAEDRNFTLPSLTWASSCPWVLGRGKNESVQERVLFFLEDSVGTSSEERWNFKILPTHSEFDKQLLNLKRILFG